MVFACVGEVLRKDLILGNNIKPEDSVVGLRSSGIHSNGISLARRVLLKEWGGKYDPFDVPDGFVLDWVRVGRAVTVQMF